MSQTKAQLISDLVQALNFTGTASAPANGLFLSAANTLKLATASTERLKIDGTELVVNDTGADVDFRVEGDTEANLLFVDASADRVGIGTNSPSNNLEVASTAHTGILIQSSRTNASDNIGALDFRSSSTNVARIQSLVDGTIKFRNTSALTERMRIDSSGNVGIGTTSPSKKLDVSGEFRSTAIFSSGATSGAASANQAVFDYNISDTRILSYNSSGSSINLFTNPSGGSLTSRLSIDSSGKVGIGTTSPATILHVKANVGDMLRLDRDNSGAVGNQIAFRHKDGSGNLVETCSINAVASSNAADGNLRFHTKTSGGSNTEKLRITEAGRVGIGTTSPQEELHISADTPVIRLTDSSTDRHAQFVCIDGSLRLDADNNNDQSSTNIAFRTDGTERMRIDSSGNVGIGTTSPGALLHVKTTTSKTDSVEHMLILEHLSSGTTTTGVGTGIRFRGERNNGVMQNIGDINFEADVNSGSNISAALVFKPALSGVTTERMRIHSSGIVTVGNDASGAATYGGQMVIATTSGGVLTCADTGSGERLRLEGGSGLGRIGTDSNHDLVFITNGTSNERMRITSAGRLIIGTTTASSAGNSQYSLFEVSGNTSGATGPGHITIKRGTASASLSNGDTIGRLIFSGLDGGDFAFIQASVDADNTTDFPARLMFYTCADGATSATERMRIDHSGKVGINNTSLNADFSVSNSNTSQNSAFVDIGKAGGNRFKLGYEGNNCFFGGTASTAMFIFKNNVTQSENPQASGNERMRIDGYGRLMVGTTTSTSNQSGRLNVFGTDGDSAFVSIRRGSDNASGPRFAMCKNRNTTDGSYSGGIVQDGDILGTIHFYANDGQGFEEGAAIQATIDGTPGSNDVPTMIKFQTTPDGSDTKQERMRIKQDGNVAIGKTSNFGNGGTTGIELNGGSHYSMFVRGSNTPMYVGRNSTTGIIVSYLYNGTQRGTISTDGTVISLTGTSDYRLKENNITISDGIARLKQLKPYRFNFKETPSKTIDGFFAHEVDLVVPEAVFGDKDAVATEEDVQSGISVGDIKPQQLDQSKLVPLLTAALQEEISKREALEARVAALEAA